MSALDDLKEKDIEKTTCIEDCILQVAKGVTWPEQATAEGALEELAAQAVAIEAARVALKRIANGNPATKVGAWLTDIEMADIARAALTALEGK